jgi:hypothetical protein
MDGERWIDSILIDAMVAFIEIKVGYRVQVHG